MSILAIPDRIGAARKSAGLCHFCREQMQQDVDPKTTTGRLVSDRSR
jgi:hypothetical protein